MAEYRIKPGGMHHRALSSRKKIKVVGGGFGNGKTALACIQALQLVKDYPGCNGIIAMATYSQLNDTIREEFYKWVPASSVKRWPTMADNTMIFKNGSKVNFRYIKQKGKAAAADGQTSSNLLSATYDWAIVDQIENPAITYKDFLDLLGRLRGSTAYKGTDATMPITGPRWLVLTANPSFNWVYHKLIKPYVVWKRTGEITKELIVHPKTQEPLIEVFEAATYENEHNLERDFIETLEAAYVGQFKDRYIGGEWGAFEGLVYPMFDMEKHIMHKAKMLQYLWSLNYKGIKPITLEGFDFGIASPSCYLIGFCDHMGRVFIIDGFYKKEMDIAEIGDRIVTMQMEYFPFLKNEMPILADPSIFKRTVLRKQGYGADTIKSILTDNYHIHFKPGQNEILNGISKVASYLTVKSFPDIDTYERDGCLIYFASHLTFVFDEFQSYFWKMTDGFERTDTPIDRNDHAMDTLKYLFSYLPQAAELMFNYSAQYGGNPEWMRVIQKSL